MAGGKVADAIRAFVALDLDAKSVRRVVRLADRLRMASGAPSATWTPQDSVHLTLKFMASLPAAAVAPLSKALGALVQPGKAPQPGVCRLHAFPSVEQANVIVIELVDPRGDLSKLAARIEKLASRHGVAREARDYVPHVTLARLKRPYDSRRWLRSELADAAGEFTVSHLTLYRSELGASKEGGSLYVPLARFEYGPA
jgi:2'-5' RNA ligase